MNPVRKRRLRGALVAAWLVLLAASHLHRALGPEDADAPKREGAAILATPEVGRGSRVIEPDENNVRVAFVDRRPAGRSEAPVLVLVHGTPGDGRTFDRLAPLLDGEFRLVIPDLPGFGGSTPGIPDYSIVSHAAYLAMLLDGIGSGPAHLAGFSRGGAVALVLADHRPDLADSLTLISSIGVLEHELLGDHTLNHAVHAAQFGVLWVADRLVPHFGMMDDFPLNLPHARSFLDSDQRPLRGVLDHWRGPMLLIHGRTDGLVPLSAAVEHARIVPQAETHFFDGGHLALFTDPASVAEPLREFVRRVESGDAITRGAASPERVSAAALPASPRRLDADLGGFALVTLLLALATFVSEDLTCLSAGLLVAKGSLGFLTATVACLIGIFVGDMLLFYAGRWFGLAALHRAPLRWFLDASRVEQARAFFERRTGAMIFATRFVPGTRLPTYFAAGLTGTSPGRFARWFLLAAAVWTPLLVGVSMLLGQTVLRTFEQYEGMALWGLAVAAILFFAAVRLLLPLLSWKGRRLLLSRWRRLTRWEFWPAWAVYPPVALHFLRLALRHRSLTVFTAANPAIPCGGLVLESKSAILQGLEPSGAVAPFTVIRGSTPSSSKAEALAAFLRRIESGYPVVLKPDVGERGQGVAILPDSAAAAAYLDGCPDDVIAQKHVAGPEFGVFYFRYPDQAEGTILSITEKRLVTVTGDGRSTLEELILGDDRAVCMARFFLDRHRRHLSEIPDEGERIPLTQLGTHCRGALFLDGNRHATPELTRAVDHIARAFPGFHFGRFDIRAPSVEAFREGRDLSVLELNGVTSESTDIYDPSHSLLFAWRRLAEQWTICFEVGRRNVARGARPAPLREIVDRIRRFRRKDRFEAPRPPDRLTEESAVSS